MKAIVLLIPRSKARKSSNQASWDWFCRLLEPRPESHQIEPPGTGFLHFWCQGQKVIKSSLLGLVLSTSWANAEKSLNQVSWDSFCLIGSRYQHIITSGEHLIIGSSFIGSPARGSPVYSPNQRGTHEKYVLRESVSIIICPPPLSHPILLWPAESVLHEG